MHLLTPLMHSTPHPLYNKYSPALYSPPTLASLLLNTTLCKILGAGLNNRWFWKLFYALINISTQFFHRVRNSTRNLNILSSAIYNQKFKLLYCKITISNWTKYRKYLSFIFWKDQPTIHLLLKGTKSCSIK